jgi:hypothetical protein
MGAAGFEPAASRVSGDKTPGRSAHLRAAGVASDAPGFSAIPSRTHQSRKSLQISPFRDGRGGFRTCDLSRVKHGVRGGLTRENTCKSSQTREAVSIQGWA